MTMRSRRCRLRAMVLIAMAAVAGTVSLPSPAQASGPDDGKTPAAASSTTVITIDNFAFNPPRVVVAAGTRVTWLNRDDMPHNVVDQGTPRAFKSPTLDTDERFSVTLTQPGTYAYFCGIHPKMVGVVVVTAP